jgi:hypothetical protein
MVTRGRVGRIVGDQRAPQPLGGRRTHPVLVGARKVGRDRAVGRAQAQSGGEQLGGPVVVAHPMADDAQIDQRGQMRRIERQRRLEGVARGGQLAPFLQGGRPRVEFVGGHARVRTHQRRHSAR